MSRRAAFLVPVGIALALYAVTLGFGRTFDDLYHIPAPDERPPRTLSDVWTQRYWGDDEGGGLYRPVVSTTYWIEARLGLPLALRHAVNVLSYAAVTALLVRLALGLGLGAGAAGMAGVLFAVHPAHVETVAGLVGRAELLAALGMLAALLLHDRLLTSGGARQPGRGSANLVGGLGIAAASFLAAGSKESAWLLPLFALPLHAVRKRGPARGLPAWAGYAVGIGGHLLLRRAVLGGWLNAPDVIVDPTDNPLVALEGLPRFVAGLRVVGLNFAHLLLPWRMSPDYSGGHIHLGGGIGDPRLWGGLFLLAGSAALGVHGFRRRESRHGPVFLVAGVWLLVNALFSMNLVLDLGTVLAERLLFWATLALALLFGGIAAGPGRLRRETGERVPARSPRRRLGALLPGVAVLLVAAVHLALAARYLPAWRSDATLFSVAMRVTPESPRVWFNHGRAVHDEGRLDEALAAYRRARALAPGDYQAWAQEAAVLLQQGKFGEAEQPLAEALRFNPEDGVSLVNEGVLWMEHGEVERAASRFREVLSREPERSEALLNLALAEGRLGRPAEAETRWREYLGKKPRDPEALNNLAWLLATALDRPAEGEPYARQAVSLDPGDANLRDTLAETLQRQGKRDDAARVAREALALGPSPALQSSLQRFLSPAPADSTTVAPR